MIVEAEHSLIVCMGDSPTAELRRLSYSPLPPGLSVGRWRKIRVLGLLLQSIDKGKLGPTAPGKNGSFTGTVCHVAEAGGMR
jgi:hypothetical protein